MTTSPESAVSKVPEVTLGFWITKILATTLGETGGDAVSMSTDLGYLVGTGIFAVIFAVAVGLTLADFVTRSLGIGFAGGSSLLLALVLASLWIWYRAMGSVAIDTVATPRAEIYYWVTIMFSQTLGTALGDWTTDSAGFGYTGVALIFGGLLAVVAALNYRTSVSRTVLFWSAFILTRPLGAVLGDFLDKPVGHGGLAMSRYTASFVLLAATVVCILAFPPRAATRAY